MHSLPKMLNAVPHSMNTIVADRSYHLYHFRHPQHTPLTHECKISLTEVLSINAFNKFFWTIFKQTVLGGKWKGIIKDHCELFSWEERQNLSGGIVPCSKAENGFYRGNGKHLSPVLLTLATMN